MNKELIESYRNHFGHAEYVQPVIQLAESVEVTDENKPLLDAIYALDPVTNLPSGDIACFVSANTSPEVKKFILDNIMCDTSKAALPPVPDGIDDDTAFYLSRGIDESVESYTSRLNKYAESNLELRDQLISDAKRLASDTSKKE